MLIFKESPVLHQLLLYVNLRFQHDWLNIKIIVRQCKKAACVSRPIRTLQNIRKEESKFPLGPRLKQTVIFHLVYNTRNVRSQYAYTLFISEVLIHSKNRCFGKYRRCRGLILFKFSPPIEVSFYVDFLKIKC